VKRYRFRLESVLRVRRAQEALAVAALQQANAAVVAAARHVGERVEVLHSLPAPAGVQPRRDFTASTQRRLAAAAATSSARADLALVRGVAAERSQLWNLAAQRVAVLEHVDEHRRTEHSHELRREEERVVDELVTTAYRRRTEDTPT